MSSATATASSRKIELLRASDSFISQHFDELQGSILTGMQRDPNDHALGTIILKMLLEDPNFDLWVGSRAKSVSGTLTTRITNDPLGGRALLIYGYHFPVPLSPPELRRGFERLKSFMQQRNCAKMVLYTNLPALGRLAASMGFRQGQVQYLYEGNTP